MDLPLMHSGQAVASTDSQVSYTAQKESGPLCVNHVQLAVSFADHSYVTSKKGELKMQMKQEMLQSTGLCTVHGMCLVKFATAVAYHFCLNLIGSILYKP